MNGAVHFLWHQIGLTNHVAGGGDLQTCITRDKLLLGKNLGCETRLHSLEDLTGHIGISNDAKMVCIDSKTLLQCYGRSAARTDRIGGLIKNMASKVHALYP